VVIAIKQAIEPKAHMGDDQRRPRLTINFVLRYTGSTEANMVIVAIIGLLVLGGIAVASMHLGPHSSTTVSVAALVVAVLVVIAARASSPSSDRALLYGVGGLVSMASLIMVTLGLWAMRHGGEHVRRSVTSSQQLIGRRGVATTTVGGTGMVRIAGELWQARTLDQEVPQGTHVLVAEVEGLIVSVVPDPLDHRDAERSHK
jgi:membrane-bound ClpP family serine protease